jgi:diadenylate cyclase
MMFFFSTLTWFGWVDLCLVTVTFYLLLSLVRRSSAAYLLREVLVLGIALFILITVLPLPVFDWLVRAVLVATLVAIPIVFQVQLRHFIERAGRAIGLSQAARQSAAETVLPELIHAVTAMSDSKIGALIVLEGNDSLEDVIESGVLSGGRVASQSLQSIFYPGAPLHDGAVVIRTDKILAAGCVLPLTQQDLEADKRLGTRHRAAVGLSETSDALVIVVSEETGTIAVAQYGQLQRPLRIAELRDRLLDFYEPTMVKAPAISLLDLAKQVSQQLRGFVSLSNPRQLLSNLGFLSVSLLLAFIVWSFVIEQTDPTKLARVENIALRIENLPPNTKLIPAPPASVSAIIQTTEEVLPTLSSKSFQAAVALQELQPGLYRLPVMVKSGVPQVLVRSLDPPILDVELVPVISRTLPVMVETPLQQDLSAAYELVGTPTAKPDHVEVTGPAPLMEQVSQVQTTVSLAGASGLLREIRPVRALDEQGREVTGVSVQPNQVQVSVTVRRRLNVSQVSIRAVTSGTPPSGYWLSNLSVTPASVALQGRPDELAEIGGYVDTLPVDISAAIGEMRIQIPLDLPPHIQVIDDGGAIEAVNVLAQITPRTGDLTMTRPIELLKVSPNFTVTLNPPEVDLLLSGPLPVLNEIEDNPDLVRVSIDTTDLGRGQNTDVTPTIVVPAGIQTQLVPPSVLVILE